MNELFTSGRFYFSSHDLSCIRLVSTRGARVHALCSRVCAQLAKASANRKANTSACPMRRLLPLASQSGHLRRFLRAYVSFMAINLAKFFFKVFSTDKVFSLDDLNDNFLELSEVTLCSMGFDTAYTSKNLRGIPHGVKTSYAIG